MDLLSISSGALRYHQSPSDLQVVGEIKNAQETDITTNISILPYKCFAWWHRIHSKVKIEQDSCVEVWRLKDRNEHGKKMIKIMIQLDVEGKRSSWMLIRHCCSSI
jgi:hypothetical protein